MNFEVRRGTDIVMQTCFRSCIPSQSEREMLRKAGYKLYIDGKLYAEKKKVDKILILEDQMEGQISFLDEGK